MATNQTTNYQLNQWEPTDQVLRTDFNADNAKVDTALADLAENKADQADLDTLSGAVTGLASTVAGHTTALTALGNCEIQVTSYVGTGDQAWGVQRDGYYTGRFTWNGSQARFWWTDEMGQMNYENQTYRVVAFFAMD